MRSIGQAARRARRARKLTQEDVADRVGVSTQFYGRIERGYALPSVTTLRRMLEVLDLHADELLGEPEADIDLDDDGVDADSRSDDDDDERSQDMDSPRLRRLMRFLRRASPVTLHVVEVLLDQMDRAGALLHGQGSARADAPDEGNAAPDDRNDDQDDDASEDEDDDAEPGDGAGEDDQ